MLNALTVDVEDYFQVSAFEHRISRSGWGQCESRVVANTQRLLSIFEEHRVHGTFFVLGWVAERFPELVREIDARGHEIGSHSYWHRLIYTITKDEFRADLRRSKDVLETLVGRPIELYRAPSFSITDKSRWALEILSEEGIKVDSSVFPVRHDRYGIRDAPRDPHVHMFGDRRLIEFPPSSLSLGTCRLPIGGGGYFRLFPVALTCRGVQQANDRKCPFMFYIHPWEIDPHQPRIDGVGWRSRARHYVNLARTEAKLRQLLGEVEFGTISEVMEKRAALFPNGEWTSDSAAPIESRIAGRSASAPADT
jgi:polysaccharide deacetylase family protein (PEP-CTERM system associated)